MIIPSLTLSKRIDESNAPTRLPQGLGCCHAGPSLTVMAADAASQGPRLTPAEVIEREVRKSRPLLGGKIPANLKARLGATHYDGKYCRTRAPVPAGRLRGDCSGLGMNVAKLWFGQSAAGLWLQLRLEAEPHGCGWPRSPGIPTSSRRSPCRSPRSSWKSSPWAATERASPTQPRLHGRRGAVLRSGRASAARRIASET